jgi:hypothetical protein
MNKLKENVDFFGSYFHGIQDIIECKSAKQAALGAAKILSGFTLFIPLIFAVGFYISKNELQKLDTLCGRVSKALTSLENVIQEDLIKFISCNVLDKNGDQFVEAFDKLEPDSQIEFFNLMADSGELVTALTRVPDNIREIKIGFGQNPTRETLDNTISELCNFKLLHTITFDISKTTHYSNGIENLFKKSIDVIKIDSQFKSTSKVNFDIRNDRYQVSSVSCPNNSLPASRLIEGVVYHLIKESALAKINFKVNLYPGELCPMYIANPSRMAKIPEDDVKQSKMNNPLNFMIPLPDAKDLWFAHGRNGYYHP